MAWKGWSPPKRASERPSALDITFDAHPMTVVQQRPDCIEWIDAAQDRIVARVERRTWSRPLADWTLAALRRSVRSAAATQRGGIVSVTPGRAGDLPIVKSITKFEEGSGYRYDGAIMVRFPNALYTLTLEAGEHGRTGAREAATNAILMQTGTINIFAMMASGGGPIPGLLRDPYDDSYTGPTLHSYSDDERLDALMPGHPLSKVRQWLGVVEKTLEVAADLRADVVQLSVEPSAALESNHRIPPEAAGILYLQAGHPDTAERMFAEAVPLKNGAPDIRRRDVGKTLILLGVSREMCGRAEDAVWAHQWAVRAFEATAGHKHAETIRARANLARAYAAAGNHQEAEPLLLQVIPAFEAADNEQELSVAMNALGLVRQAQNRHDDALACFERAQALFEKLRGPDYIECAAVLRNIARSADAIGDQLRSRRALKRADEIAQRRA